MTFRAAMTCYVGVSVAMVLTSLATGYRASRLTGEDHYLLTRTHLLVKQRLAPKDATEAAFDRAFQEAGEDTAVHVERPVFVLGLLDATGPVVLVGGMALAVARLVARGRGRRRPAVVDPGGSRTGEAVS